MSKRKAESPEPADEVSTKKVALSVAETPRPAPISKQAPAKTTSLAVPSLSSISPWQLSDIVTLLPPLPPILSKELELQAFTHPGCITNAIGKSYERLEFLGDAYLELIASLLVSSTFTAHTPGKLSALRESLVKNETLAEYARRYGFESRMNVPVQFFETSGFAHKFKSSGKTKVLGDIFEAYVAAVIESDPNDGVQKVSTWLKSLWTLTIARQIREELDRQNREHKRKLVDPTANPSVLSKDRLRQVIGCKGVKFSYRDEGEMGKNEQGLPLYGISCWLDEGLGETNRRLGVGFAKSKSEAGLNAAQNALDNSTLMQELKAKKEAQVQKEKDGKGLASSRWA